MTYRMRDLRVVLGVDWGNASPGCVLWGVALPDGHVAISRRMEIPTHVREGCRLGSETEVFHMEPRSRFPMRVVIPSCSRRKLAWPANGSG